MQSNKSKIVTALHKERFAPICDMLLNDKHQQVISTALSAQMAHDILYAYYAQNIDCSLAQFHAMSLYKKCIAIRKAYKKELRRIRSSDDLVLKGEITSCTNKYWIEMIRTTYSAHNIQQVMDKLQERVNMPSQTVGLSITETRALNSDMKRILSSMRR